MRVRRCEFYLEQRAEGKNLGLVRLDGAGRRSGQDHRLKHSMAVEALGHRGSPKAVREGPGRGEGVRVALPEKK